jgi:hypothetical protein
MSSGQRRRRRSGDTPASPVIHLGDNFNGYLASEWLEKKGQEGKVLLGCVKLLGQEAKKVSASNNFAAFATVDASGIVYLMKILQ